MYPPQSTARYIAQRSLSNGRSLPYNHSFSCISHSLQPGIKLKKRTSTKDVYQSYNNKVLCIHHSLQPGTKLSGIVLMADSYCKTILSRVNKKLEHFNWIVTISHCFVWVVYTPLERLCLHTHYLPF